MQLKGPLLEQIAVFLYDKQADLKSCAHQVAAFDVRCIMSHMFIGALLSCIKFSKGKAWQTWQCECLSPQLEAMVLYPGSPPIQLYAVAMSPCLEPAWAQAGRRVRAILPDQTLS